MTETTDPVEPDLQRTTSASSTRQSPPSRRFIAGLLAVAVLALGVRLFYTVAVADDIALGGDAERYHLLAHHLAEGDGYVQTVGFLAGTPTAEFPPLFPAVLSVFDLLGGDSVKSQRFFTSVLGTITVLLIGLAGRHVRGPTVGLVAGGLAAVYPMLFQVDTALMAETLYALFVSAFLLAVYRAIETPSTVRWVVAGLLVGLAALTRTEGILLFPLVIVPEALRRGAVPRRVRWRAIGLSAAATFVVITPWIARNAITFDRFIPISNNSGTLLAGANCDRSYNGQYRGAWRLECVTDIDVFALEPAVADRYRDVGLDYASDHVSELPGVVAARVLRTFGLYEPKQQLDWEAFEGRDITWHTAGHRMFLVLLPLAIAGAVLLWRAKRPVWPLIAPVVCVVFTAAVSYGNQRFRILAEPGILILAAVSLVALGRLATSARSDGPRSEVESAVS